MHTVRSDAATPLELTTSTLVAGSETPVLHVLQPSARTDVDLDGSFSDEHAGGLLHARALLAAAQGEEAAKGIALVLEHALAISDVERWRCLLVYGDEQHMDERASDEGDLVLRQLMLLTEQRLEPLAEPEPPSPLSAPSLDELVGTWVGDACARAPKDAELPQGSPSDLQLFGHTSTNVYNAKLEYTTRELWDGNRAVSRTLRCTSFSGEEMEPIVSSGALAGDAFANGGLPTIRFGGSDSSALFLLPGGAHAIAPTRIGADRPFATEFAAVLSPGESFGWESYALQEALDDGKPPSVLGAPGGVRGVSRGEFPTRNAMTSINDGISPGDGAPRLARVQRLYSGRDAFVSGTTSLLSSVSRRQ